MSKIDEYKSSDSSEDDEQSMSDPFKELENARSDSHIVNRLSHSVLVIPEIRAVNRPDSHTNQQIHINHVFEHIKILQQQVADMQNSFRRDFCESQTRLQQQSVDMQSSFRRDFYESRARLQQQFEDMNNSFYHDLLESRAHLEGQMQDLRLRFEREKARTRVGQLCYLLAEYGADIEVGIIKRLAEKCPGLEAARLTRIKEVKLLIEGKGQKFKQQLCNLDELKTAFYADPSIQILAGILENPEFRIIYQSLTVIFYSSSQYHQEIERRIQEIKTLPMSERDSETFELAIRFYNELIQVPDHEELVRLAENVFSVRN